MQKKVIISGLLTIIVLISTFNIWLLFKPLDFETDITSNKKDVPLQVELLLNRKNEPNFTKAYYETAMINLKNTNHCKIIFEHKTPPKRFKIILKNTIPNSEYNLSNITFKSGEKRIDDLSLFSSDDGKLVIKNNSLVIVPQKHSFTLEYKEELNIKRYVKFSLELFLIIGILSYLLFFKLTSYLAEFKINKNVSGLDIVFLTIFTILLIIPSLHINLDEISVKENRTLAKFPALFDKENHLNLNYGKNLENWFNDRFGGRKIFFDLYYVFRYPLSPFYRNVKAYIDKKNNWAFNVPLQVDPIEPSLQEKISIELEKFNVFCKENNIKLYFLIVPKKETLYSQYTYQKIIKDNYLPAIEYFKKTSSMPIIYPFDELKEESKNNYVFFKTDHHWTDVGAYIGYQSLMKEIIKDFNDIKILSKNDFIIKKSPLVKAEWGRDFTVGHTLDVLNLNSKSKKILDVEYDYFTHKDSKLRKLIVIDNDKTKQKDFYYPKGSNYKLLMVGTSMNENLTEILPYSFKMTKHIRLNGPKDVVEADRFKVLKVYKNNILDYKPDIIVFCIKSGNIPSLINLTKED